MNISRIAVVWFHITIKHKNISDICDLTHMRCVKKHTIKIEEVIMKLYNTEFKE